MKRRIPWQDPSFYDEADLKKELRRVFDICHGCRRCFNLCGLFPKLFEIMDSPEVDGDVAKLSDQHIDEIIPLCTFCDMCFLAKCPYIPPHPWNVDFPRLMLRYKAIQARSKAPVQGKYKRWVGKQMATVDRYAPLASACAPVANKVAQCGCLRKVAEKVTDVDARARMPEFQWGQSKNRWTPPEPNEKGPAYGQEVWLYLTCFSNYYQSKVTDATAKVLSHLGVRIHPVYPGCCGMPLWEQGCLKEVSQQAHKVAAELAHAGTVVALTPSCTLMLKSEWPSLCPEDPLVQELAEKTQDLSQYALALTRSLNWSLPHKLSGEVGVHMACHVRAQNAGNKSYEWLSLLSQTPPQLIEKCSGHGGIWGFMKGHFQIATAMAKKVLAPLKKKVLVTECPLAREHLEQTVQDGQESIRVCHPMELVAEALESSTDTPAE